ncbi:MAG: copper-binding protein [Myxococcota bacterium]
MKPRLSRPAALVVLALSAAFSTACSPPAPTEHAGHGVAVDVDPTARTVTLEHGDIPGLMKAMTMTFPVAPEVDLATVAKGETVDFEVQSQGSSVTVTAIRKASAPEPQASTEPQPASAPQPAAEAEAPPAP